MSLVVIGNDKHSFILAQLAAISLAGDGNKEIELAVEGLRTAIESSEIMSQENFNHYMVSFNPDTFSSAVTVLHKGALFNQGGENELTAISEEIGRATYLHTYEEQEKEATKKIEIGCLYFRRAKGGVTYWRPEQIIDGKVYASECDRNGKALRRQVGDKLTEMIHVNSLVKLRTQPLVLVASNGVAA